MARQIKPEDTTRLMAFELWMKAPNPMMTFFKTLDITNLIKVSKRKGFKFNMLMNYCIGKAAVNIKEFYILPTAAKKQKTLMRFSGPLVHEEALLTSRVAICSLAMRSSRK